MKKIILLLYVLLMYTFGFAQCITTEDANNTVSSCKFGGRISAENFNTSNTIVAPAQKWITSIFTTVMEPAIKKTKGLRGTLSGEVKISNDDGLTPYVMYATMQELGCTKSQKLYEKDESGIIITFYINSLNGIAETIKHSEYVVKKGSTEEKSFPDKIDGRQLYLLNQPTASEKYAGFTFYRKEEDGTKNLAVAKDGVPLFIPVSIKDILVLKKANFTLLLNGQNKMYNDFINMGVEGYLAQMDLPAFEKNFGKEATEKAKADYIKTYNDQVAGYKKMIEENPFKKLITGIDVYLKKSSAAQLAKPCIIYNEAFLNNGAITDAMFFDNAADGLQYITINPIYRNNNSSTTPQFICVQTKINARSAASLTGKKDFEDNLDFKKLQSMLQ